MFVGGLFWEVNKFWGKEGRKSIFNRRNSGRSSLDIGVFRVCLSFFDEIDI